MAEKVSTITSWEKQALGVILQKKIKVPEYQRVYTWDDDNIDDLIHDLNDFLDSDYDSYLFGQMIFCEDNGVLEIIDGQQRLTTMVIFMSALRKLAIKYEIEYLNDFKNDINKCMGSKKYGKDDYNLTLGKINGDYFLRTIQYEQAEDVKLEYDSNKLIQKAFDKFYGYYDEELESIKQEKRGEYLKKLYMTVTEKFFVSYVTTNDPAQAYIIFETLNSRGKDLDAIDILKNYFFRVCKADKMIMDGWEKMIDKIYGLGEPPTSFIRAYWNSKYAKRYGFARKKDLFKKISQYIKGDESKGKAFVKELYSLRDVYVDLINPEGSCYFKSEKIHNSLEALDRVDLRSFYPIILALTNKKNYSEEEIGECLYAVEVLLFRNIIMGNETANHYEIDFCMLASRISDDEDLDTIIEEIVSKTYSDSEFQRYFNMYKPNSDTVAKNVLRELYNYNKKERPVKKSNRTITLEHIMPQNNDIWCKDNQFVKDYCQRLGNLTLLLNKLNSSAQNDLLEDKKKDYEKSEIIETKALIYVPDTDSWNEEMIEDRQKALFEVARKRWLMLDNQRKDSIPIDPENRWTKIMEQVEPKKESKIENKIIFEGEQSSE